MSPHLKLRLLTDSLTLVTLDPALVFLRSLKHSKTHWWIHLHILFLDGKLRSDMSPHIINSTVLQRQGFCLELLRVGIQDPKFGVTLVSESPGVLE